MAEEDTQLPNDLSESDDDKPVAASCQKKNNDGRDGFIATNAKPNADSESPSEPRKWKRNLLSPKALTDSPIAPSEPGGSLGHTSHCASASKAAKRIKTREGARKANDLMECFKARAATAAATLGDVMKKPAASSSRDRNLS